MGVVDRDQLLWWRSNTRPQGNVSCPAAFLRDPECVKRKAGIRRGEGGRKKQGRQDSDGGGTVIGGFAFTGSLASWWLSGQEWQCLALRTA